MSTKDGSDKFAYLRRQAETTVHDPEGGLGHELQVYQIELELQNEELRRTQLELEASRDRYTDLYDFAPVGYFTLLETGLIVESNLTGAAMLRVDRPDLLNHPLAAFIVKEDQDDYYLFRRRLFDSQLPQTCEIRLTRQDHSQFYALLEGIVTQDKGKDRPECRIALSDITERKLTEITLRESYRRLEKTLIELKETQQMTVQQERLAAVGQLAAGIAHDFNNILTSILGFAELLREAPDIPEPAQVDLTIIIRAGERAKHLVRQVLDFSRKSIRQPKPFDLAPFFKEVINFLERLIPENISVNLEIESGVYLLEADPTQIQQVLTNLVINARDAMPRGGPLRVLLARMSSKGGELRCAGCNQVIAGEWIGVMVTDSGSGIPPTVLPHIFEPFFTTKEIGQGSGLGLAQVLGIVEQHAGHITVDSQVGRGTTFTIYLPLLILDQPGVELKDNPLVRKGQGETILLVEDEATVLEASRRMLESLGYQVLTAANGRKALAIYQEYKTEITLVISDMVMPDMDGEVLFNLLKAQNPELKLVIMSGYPLGEKGAMLLQQGVVDWFHKPILLRNLSQVIGKVLQLEYYQTSESQ